MQVGRTWLAKVARILKRLLPCSAFVWIVDQYSAWMMAGRQVFDVQAQTLHALLQRPECEGSIALLKVDVEGAELQVCPRSFQACLGIPGPALCQGVRPVLEHLLANVFVLTCSCLLGRT